MANEAIMPIVVTFRDEASAGLSRVSQNVNISARQWKSAATSIGHFGQAMTNILVLANLLPGSLGATVNKTLLLATTTINAVYAISQLVSIYQKLNITLRATIALQAIAQALTGIGIAKVAIGVAAGAALAGTALAMADRASGSGMTASVPAGRPAPNQSNTVNVYGPMMGNESDARWLSRRLTELGREDARMQGL